MDIEDEACTLADVAKNNAGTGECIVFQVERQFHGQEAKIIQGAQNVLDREGVKGTTFPAFEVGIIWIQA